MRSLRHSIFVATLFLGLSVSAGEITYRRVVHELGGVRFENTLVQEAGGKKDRVGVLMVPNWMGPGKEANEKAANIAKMGYVVFVADVYGEGTRPKNAGEAGKAAGELRAGDRQLLRDRVSKALEVFRGLAKEGLHSRDKMAAIGFCFGGGTVLELARSGSDIPAVISFHGNLDSPRPANKGDIKARVLVLHGADDPYVPVEQVAGFKAEMKTAKPLDWQLVEFGDTVHSFTNPAADSAGARYNERSSRRAFEYMEELLEEVFGDDDGDKD